MPDERPIEKLLRDYARQRREHSKEVGQLHPATERMLLAEVARQFRPEKGHAGTFGRSSVVGLWRFWSKLSLATGVAAILIVAFWLWPQAQKQSAPTLLAKHEPAPTSLVRPSPQSVPTAGRKATKAAAPELDRSTRKPETDRAESPASPPAASFAVASLSTQTGASGLDALTNSPAGPGQEYANAPSPVTATDNLAANVLANFRLEQNGSAVRVLDSDGSVYTGSLQTVSLTRYGAAGAGAARRVGAAFRGDRVALSTAAREQLEARPEARADILAVAEPLYELNFIGTNQSLKENVVFTGTLVAAPTNSLNQLRDQRSNQQFLNNYRITGRAQVGSQHVEVNALPKR